MCKRIILKIICDLVTHPQKIPQPCPRLKKSLGGISFKGALLTCTWHLHLRLALNKLHVTSNEYFLYG